MFKAQAGSFFRYFPGIRDSLLSIIGAVFLVVLFFAYRDFLSYIIGGHDGSRIWIIQIVAYSVSLSLFWVRYDAFGDVFRRITRVSCIGICVYLMFEPPDFTLVEGGRADLQWYVSVNFWPVLLCAILGMFRPSFAYAVVVYTLTTRMVVEPISGYRLSFLDIRYMMEMAEFLVISGIGLVLLRRGAAAWISVRNRDTELQNCIAFAAIGFHLGNYFWSAHAKWILGPNPWTWVFENTTEEMLLIAAHKGVLPIALPPWLFQASYDFFSSIGPISNAFVFGFQAFALIAVFWLAWLRLATLAYDALHVGIFILGGLFFWPWVWNNVSVLIALKDQTDRSIGWAPKLVCAAVIIMGGLFQIGHPARLGWYDVRDIRSPVIELREKDSETWQRVPVSFFLSHSYAMSHGYFGLDEQVRHYKPTTWGSVYTYERLLASGTCQPLPLAEKRLSHYSNEQLRRLEKFLLAHHSKMVERQQNGHRSFYMRSHHHPSNPLLYPVFNKLDLSNVVEYRFLDMSVCLSISEGTLIENVQAQDAYVFKVK